MHSSSLLVKFAPWIFVFLWSTGFVGAKYSLPYAEPFTLLLIRMLITVVVFLGLIVILKAKKITPVQAMHQMVVGGFVHVGYLGCVFAAINLGMPAGVSAIIVGLQPIITAILAMTWLNERLMAAQWVGLFAGFVGVVIVLVSGQQMGDFNVSKIALSFSFVSVLSISIGTLYQKLYGQGVDLITGSFYQYLMTCLLLAVIAFLFESGEVNWTIELVLSIAWLVFGLSVTAVLLLMYLIRMGEATKVASYFYLVPVFAVVETWILFDEQLSTMSLVGMVLAVLGIYLVLKTNDSKNATDKA